MATGPAIYLGQVGSTGRSTGPHSHKEVIDLKTGKRIPLSQARSDIGQRIQFRLPGSKEWQQLYRQISPGQFSLNPAAPLTSPKGTRTHPVTGQQAYHFGEDYGLPQGTDLRFLGTGSVEGIANYGNAGNVARLRTGDNRYQLDVFHLSKLPGAAKIGGTTAPAAPVLPGSQAAATTGDSNLLLQAFVQNQLQNQTQQGQLIEALVTVLGEKEKPKTLMEQVKEGLIGGMMQQALSPKNFLSQFTDSEPYLQGQRYATSQFFGM